MPRTRVRPTRRGRLVLALLIAAATVAAGRAATGASSGEAAGRQASVVGTDVHLVRRGDTLWEIAREVVGPEGDPRPAVEDIRRRNGLGAGPLLPGRTLVIP